MERRRPWRQVVRRNRASHAAAAGWLRRGVPTPGFALTLDLLLRAGRPRSCAREGARSGGCKSPSDLRPGPKSSPNCVVEGGCVCIR